MSTRCVPLLIGLALTAACSAPRPAAQASAPVATAEIDAAVTSAATQVRRCYRTPRVSFAARQIITRLRVRVTSEGNLSGLPAVVGQMGVTAASEPFAGRMAEAAIEAVLRCAPLTLPAAVYIDGAVEFDLVFSPLAAG